MLIGVDASRAAVGKRTGTEAYAYYLIQALIPQALEKGYWLRLYFNRSPEAALFGFPGPSSQGDRPAIEQLVIPMRRLWTHGRLALELSRRPPDVFFTPAHVIPFTYGRPAVATVHDLGFHSFPKAHTRRQLAYLRWSTGHNARRGRRVIADSLATRDDLVRLYAINPAKIDVIHPGINPELRPVRDQGRLAASWARCSITPPYLLFIGTLQPRKNLERLIAAYAAGELAQQLVLAGQAGWLSEPILAQIQALPAAIREKIHLPGFVAEEDKAALISGADALLFPSLYEGFGFPVLEGQACGTPVLCSNSSSLPEVAGEGALLVDPLSVEAIKAGLQAITTDVGLRKRLVQAGAANVRRFSWPAAAGQLLASLERALV